MAVELVEVEEAASPASPPPHESQLVKYLLLGMFLMMFVCALYFARDFFMPVVLAFLLTLTLTPIVRFLRKRGVPAPLSATLLVLTFAVAFALIGYMVSGPAVRLFNDAPRIGRALQDRLADIRKPLDQILKASEQVDKVSDGTQGSDIQKVVVAQPGLISRAASNFASVATSAAITLILALFLLSSGTLFYEKIIQSFALLSDKKRALRLVYDVEREISRYLLTVSVINCCLGIAVGLGLWAIGVPDPLVFAIAAALLNFLPYIGALIGIALVAVISLVTFETIGYAIVAPLFYFGCTIVEGQFLTPLIVGRRLELNAVSIFIAMAFWTWLWGAIGTLIAVPLLVVVKVFCDHFEDLSHVGNFLAAQHVAEPEE